MSKYIGSIGAATSYSMGLDRVSEPARALLPGTGSTIYFLTCSFVCLCLTALIDESLDLGIKGFATCH